MFEYGKEYKSMRSLLWYVISFAALLFVFMFVLLIADKRATCLENSGVWAGKSLSERVLNLERKNRLCRIERGCARKA